MPSATEPKPGILRGLRIKRVALVDNGANLDRATGDGAHIMLFKRDGDPRDLDIDDWESSPVVVGKATLDAAARHALPDSAFAAVWVDATGKKHRKLPIHDAGHLAAARGRIDGADIPAHVKAEAERRIEAATRHHQSNGSNGSKEKSATMKNKLLKGILGLFAEQDPAKRAAAIADLEKVAKADGADGDDDGDADDEPVHKADDPMCKCAKCMAKRKEKLDKAAREGDVDAKIEKAVADLKVEMQKRVDAAEARATAAETVAKAQQTAFDRAEMVSVLKSFRATPFDLSAGKAGEPNDVDKFLTLKRVAPAEYERTMTILKSADAQLAASALYRNVGVSGSGTGSAWDQIEAKADTLMEKLANAKLTREQAIEKVCLDNPKLAQQYRNEMQGVAVQ